MHIAICLTILLFGTCHALQHVREILSLSRAKILREYPTEESVFSHVTTRLSQLMDPNHRDFNLQHVFIISTNDAFDPVMLESFVGAQRFAIFSKDHYQVTITPALLNTITTEQAENILGVTPLVPAMKMSHELATLSSTCMPFEDMKLTVALAALPSHEVDAFTTWMDGMAMDRIFDYDSKRRIQPDYFTYLRINTTCANIETVAKILADQNEVIWVESFRYNCTHTFPIGSHAILPTIILLYANLCCVHSVPTFCPP